MTKLYRTWDSMKARCKYPSTFSYRNYGARGIAVCEEWQSFDAFRDWALANGFGKGLTIDRLDSSGDYYPDNCRWIPKSHQQDNTRRTIHVTYRGKRVPLPKLCREMEADTALVRGRVQSGWDIERALFEPKHRD